MNDFNADGPSESEWEEQGELAWNEFDWERYLRERQLEIERYLSIYEQAKGQPDRIDETARLMGWDDSDWNGEESESLDVAAAEAEYDDLEPYTVHRNPVFISTKAIYLGLQRGWEKLASDPLVVSQPVAVALQGSLYRGESQSILAIQALDLGDFAMAISLFKRALSELNLTLGLADQLPLSGSPALAAFHGDLRPRLFDLREIWLRVITECRDETIRPVDGES